jgi:hypothetical protein
MPLNQLPWNPAYEFFIGRATVSEPPHFFVLSRGIAFTDGVDGLDYYRAALLEMEDSTKVVLRQHRGGRPGWTDICLDDRREDAEEIDRIVSSVMPDLNLSRNYLVWQYARGWIDVPGGKIPE